MDFSESIAREIAGETVRIADLVEMEFASGVQRYWMGEYNLSAGTDGTGAPKIWTPTFGIGEITGIQQAFDGEAPKLKLELSGIDRAFSRLAVSADAEADYRDRPITIYQQLFDAKWQPLDSPFALTSSRMRTIEPSRRSEAGGYLISVALTGETWFSGRSNAVHAYLTPQDQEARHPGDKMTDRSPSLEARLIVWPNF